MVNSDTIGGLGFFDSTSNNGRIITASVVLGLILIIFFGLFLFIKIVYGLRAHRERRRRKDAEKRLNSFAIKGKKGRNAFETLEWEGVPVSWSPSYSAQLKADPFLLDGSQA